MSKGEKCRKLKMLLLPEVVLQLLYLLPVFSKPRIGQLLIITKRNSVFDPNSNLYIPIPVHPYTCNLMVNIFDISSLNWLN